MRDSLATKNKIVQAFLKLYENKSIEHITIGEIAREAHVNRGTFYYYFQDVYDLLLHIEQQIFEEVIKQLTPISKYVIDKNTEMLSTHIEKISEAHQDILRIFMVKRPNLELQRKIKEQGKQVALKQLGIDEDKVSIEQMHLLEYMASAQMGLIVYWIEHNKQLSILQLAKMMEMAHLEGVLTSIKQLS